jgi:hypothetical protein
MDATPMPSLNNFMMTDEAKRRFQSFQLKATAPSSTVGAVLPTAFRPSMQQLGGIGSNISKPSPSLMPQQAVPLPMPPALFLSASNSAQDVANQKQYSQEFGDFIDGMCRALCFAHDMWRKMAYFKDVMINSVTATGGTLEGPGLKPLIFSVAPMTGALGWALQYSSAIAAGIEERWNFFQRSFSIPGLPWYPSFAMIPSPIAPPMPNIPTPLAACTNNFFMIESVMLRDTIKLKLGTPGPFSDQLFEAIAAGFSQSVRMWMPMQMITQVKGTGPVPTFAPPFVPAGPVINGRIIPEPGHLAS